MPRDASQARGMGPAGARKRLTVVTRVLAVLVTLGLAPAAHANDDIRDLPFVLDAVNDALETARTNVPIPWTNPATGNSGVIVVEKTFYPSPDMPCRQYRRTYNDPGQGEMMTRGTGCRTGPARWKIEEERTASRVPKAGKSGPSTGAATEAATPPASPVGTKTASPPRTPQKAAPARTAKRPAPAPPKASTAAKAKPKPPPAAPAAPSLPKFTMPSKAEI